jgi:hypothetical protein
MLITAAFHTGIWTLLFFIVGMIKPKWPLFFLKKPDRFLILIISTILFMVSATLYGEGNRQRAAEEQTAKDVAAKIAKPSAVIAPVPEIPATPSSPKQ